MRKKNMFLKTGMAILALATAFLQPLQVSASGSDGGYTYNYDYWGDYKDSADFYTVCKVFTSSDLGLDVKLKNPQGLFVEGNHIYLCDSGNNRIIELERVSPEKLEVVKIIDSFKGGSGPNTFNNPTDVAISEDGNIFVADQGNARVLKLDKDLNYLLEFVKPTDNTLDPKLVFQPTKLAVDTAERVYCIATGINKGLIKYENDTAFSGFVGATPVTFNWTDYIWKKLASQEQRAKMESFVPTEYENIYMDYEGFIYATRALTDDSKKTENAVRKLNLMGNDILVKNGDWPVQGDLYWGSGGGYEGPSVLTDVTVMDNDIYACLDRNRGRVFGYDDQGRLVFAYGGNGNMDGYFRRPSAIEHIGHELYVLDSLDCSITAFVPTEFGNLVYTAIEDFDKGKYESSGAAWQEVMNQNGNYDLAYIGIGRALLRQEKYKEAMEYFELKYDAENYSKAYKQYRKIWVEDHIGWIVAVILVLFLVPLGIGKVKALRYEIDTADIFVAGRNG
ncbi:NHL repeat-containing protein [Butyrivibrio sp. DSM 10294]|uniref:NHL repeat-containing protein n=1 Tax=Butyrivibrio sp. DSM 10294 TaxID=2972457 RepID=UPI00234EBB1E|nr:NHL repeat-containing protein [Butyrivibrio sp. DSM 10294]MDC7294340.1 NHL repeat-containing protein [Butyrivibrio sp. DSM 10294]